MAKFRSQKNSFVAGEISPMAFGRSDLPQYQHACKQMKNVIPTVSGGAAYRPGSRHAFTDTEPMNLIPFIRSKREAYCVALASDGDVLIKRKDPDYAGGLDETPTILNSTVTGSLTFSTGSQGTEPLYDPNFEVQYTQSADILYLVHQAFKPQRISRTAADAFTVAAFDNGLTGTSFRDAWPYLKQNSTAITLAISNAAIGAGRTVTASAAFFDSLHVGAVFKSDDGAGTIGCFKVTGFTDSTHVTVEVMVALGTTAAKLTWWESAWSDYRGWPRSVTFFQQRLCYAGTTNNPDSLWLSESADYNQLSHASIVDPRSAPTGDQAFTIELTSAQLNQIQWLSSEKTLVVGTTGDEFLIDREVGTAGFGCDNAAAQVQSHYGSDYVQPQRVGDELIFISNSQLRAFVFNFEQNSYVADPLQAFFDEYPKAEKRSWEYNTKFRRIAWDSSRKTLWACDTAGNLIGMTRDRRLNLLAWHSHELGGTDTTLRREFADLDVTLTNVPNDPVYYIHSGAVASLCVVPDGTKDRDDVWICSLRKINGSWKYHVEYIAGLNRFTDSIYDNYYLQDGTFHIDNFADYNNASHLEAESVSVLFHGTCGRQVLSGKTVTAGTAVFTETVPTGNEITLAGYPYDGVIIPVRPEAGSQIGTSQGALKRIHQAIIRFYKTMSCTVGRDADNIEGGAINFREADTPMQNSAELYTGDKTLKVDCDYDRDAYLYILQDEPLPFCVVSIILEGQTYD